MRSRRRHRQQSCCMGLWFFHSVCVCALVPFNLDAEWIRFFGDATHWHCSLWFSQKTTVNVWFYFGWMRHSPHCSMLYCTFHNYDQCFTVWNANFINVKAVLPLFSTLHQKHIVLSAYLQLKFGILREHILFHLFCVKYCWLHHGSTFYALQSISLSGFLIQKHLGCGTVILQSTLCAVCNALTLVEMKMGKVNEISRDFLGKSPEIWQTKEFQHPISLCFVNENKTKDFCFSRFLFNELPFRRFHSQWNQN